MLEDININDPLEDVNEPLEEESLEMIDAKRHHLVKSVMSVAAPSETTIDAELEVEQLDSSVQIESEMHD
jgi:hypothetical protein